MTNAWRDPRLRKLWSRIGLVNVGNPRGRLIPPNAPEECWALHPALQELAYIIAWQAEEALYTTYYPRLPGVDVPEGHVEAVMAAMQRELDGEANSRNKAAPQLVQMAWERQCALAERRRWWFGAFGITPQRYQRMWWSLWRVSNTVELPDEVRRLYK